jgi:hypothetical protein
MPNGQGASAMTWKTYVENIFGVRSAISPAPSRVIPNATIVVSPIGDLIQRALFLLDHARLITKPIDVKIIQPILQARNDLAAGTLSVPTEASFRAAFVDLAVAMLPVTIESLSPECEEVARAEQRTYFRMMWRLLLFIVPFSLLSFGVSWLINDITAIIDAECRVEATLYCSGAPASARVGGSQNADTQIPVVDPVALNRANVLLFYRVAWLNILTFHSVAQDRINYLYGHGASQVFQDIYVVAQDLMKRNRLIYGAISGYVLPILYAMLGAVAYGLRSLSDQLVAKTVVPDSFLRARMRIRLAILGGVIIGLFQGFGSSALSPLAIAFLVGYAVEIFFSFLDTTVQAYKKAQPEPHRAVAP